MCYAIVLAIYRTDTRTAVLHTGPFIASAIGTSAVAMCELFTGMSVEPMKSIVTNPLLNDQLFCDAASFAAEDIIITTSFQREPQERNTFRSTLRAVPLVQQGSNAVREGKTAKGNSKE